MTTVDFIKSSLGFAHRALTDARNGTDEQLHFVPEHGSHSIAWCLWHTARIEDLIMNGRVRQQQPIWDETWSQRTGLPADGFGTGQSDEDAQQVRITDIAAFIEYQEAVWDSTREFLESATDADLEREVPTRNGTESVGQAISLHMLGHFNGHRGEMNLLRGMQGLPPLLVTEGTH
ncbi:MAG: DUF664 domain-containing protein [Dehalococcoidia bacterium]|nr:DUF664 domain-containing protein [Dehalococcoidia bacterium]